MAKCGCIEKVEKDLIEKFTQEHPNRDYEETSSFGGTGFQSLSYNFEIGTTFHHEFKLAYTYLKTNGQRSTRKEYRTVNMFPTYCSFCGVKLNEDGGE